MTACVNRKHTKKVAAVVTASLVGALSLGVAPVAAMAEDTGIDMQAANWTTGAVVSRATDGQGNQLSGDLSKPTFTFESGKFLQPTEVKGTFATTDVTEDMLTYNYNGSWHKIDDARTFFKTAPVDAYKVRVTDPDDSTVYKEFTFRIVDESKVEGVQLKGSLVYNGQPQTPKFVDGEGEDFKVTGPITYTDAIGNGSTTVAPTAAGSYVAHFTEGTQDYHIPFTIDKLDLSKASLVVEDTTSVFSGRNDLWNALEINSEAASLVSSDLTVTKVSGPNGEANLGTAYGTWTVTIAAADNQSNVTGSGTVTYTQLHDDVADCVKYGRDMYNDTTGVVNIYLEDDEAFDASKISVVDTSDNTVNGSVVNTYSGDKLEISYYDTINKKVVDASALANKGTYELTIRVKPELGFASNHWTGGTVKLTVKVNATKVDQDKTLAFYFDGEIAGDNASVFYNGEDQLGRLTVAVKDAEGNDLVEGTDYTLEIKDGKNKDVESAVDADTYTVTVKPITFDFDGTGSDFFKLTVKQAELGVSGLKNLTSKYEAPAFTGAAVEIPAAQSAVLDEDGNVVTDEDGAIVYAPIDSSLYNVVNVKQGTKVVSEAKEKGKTYTVKIALTDAASKNYKLVNDTFDFKIEEYGHFADVKSDAWYAVPVDQAWYQLYINGISGTDLYAPEADITRADAVCILFNMAGGDSAHGDNEFQFSEDTGYNTGFNDVDGHAYFAKPLAWAHASGVANGSDGNFRPYDKITREEFASLLANFAKNKGDFTAADDSVLDGMSDAGTVSDWAADNVAWAVENGVMGNGGFVAGQDNITRAEVAAMAVNYQPENLAGKNRDNI